MQYADIALPVKTANRQELFTYKIPPALLADIQIGQRVWVPFYRRVLVGTIVELRLRPPVIKGSLKDIKALADPFPLFTAVDLKLMKTIATTYATTLGEMLDSASPRPAKRVVKKYDLVPRELRGESRQAAHQIYGLYLPREERLGTYFKLIAKSRKAGRRSLVTFPSQQQASDFQKYLESSQTPSLLIVSSQELTAYYEDWLKVASGEAEVVIGTRKSIFLPIPNLGLIIVDTPSEFGYKEEQFPYYHTVTVAKLKVRAFGANLVLGDAAPRLVDWHESRQGKIRLLSKKSGHRTRITLINTANHRGLLSEVLIKHIDRNLTEGGKIALYYNRKGTARYYRCLECEAAIYCPKCDNLLAVTEVQGSPQLYCPYDNYTSSPPYQCLVCRSYQMGAKGLGILSLAKMIRQQWPNAKVECLSRESPLTSEFDIVVATAELLYLSSPAIFDLLVTFQLDQRLHGSSWSTHEAAYLHLTRLAERTKHLILQTANPEHEVIQAFCEADIDRFYSEELGQRQLHRYPPVYQLLRLTTKNQNSDKLKKSAGELSTRLGAIASLGGNSLFLPIPIPGKKNQYQILIKSALTPEILAAVPTDWRIDPEPIDRE